MLTFILHTLNGIFPPHFSVNEHSGDWVYYYFMWPLDTTTLEATE